MIDKVNYTIEDAVDTANFLLDELGIGEGQKYCDLKEAYAAAQHATTEESYWALVQHLLRTCMPSVVVPHSKGCDDV